MTQKEIIQELEKITNTIIEESETLFSPINEDVFNHNLRPKTWSIAQCLNHLNHYADFYHKQFKAVLDEDEKKELNKKSEDLKYSWLTRNFLKYIQLDENDEPIKKIKAPKKTFQVNSDFTKKEYEQFLVNQIEMLSILQMAKNESGYCVKKIKTLFPLLKMKAIDLLIINVHHNYRHFVQAKNTLQKLKIESN